MAVAAAGAQTCWPHRVALKANLTPRCLVRMRKFCCRTCCKTTSASFRSTVSTVRAFVSEEAVQCQGAAAADLLQTSMFICCLGSICAPAGYSLCGLNVKQDTGVGVVQGDLPSCYSSLGLLFAAPLILQRLVLGLPCHQA